MSSAQQKKLQSRLKSISCLASLVDFKPQFTYPPPPELRGGVIEKIFTRHFLDIIKRSMQKMASFGPLKKQLIKNIGAYHYWKD